MNKILLRAPDFDSQQAKADFKIERQCRIVRGLEGSAVAHPEEHILLNEMRQNKASIDVNRVIFEYGLAAS